MKDSYTHLTMILDRSGPPGPGFIRIESEVDSPLCGIGR